MRKQKKQNLYSAFLLLAFFGTNLLSPGQVAHAQCSAQDVVKRRLSSGEAAPAVARQKLIQSADTVPAWKRIEIGSATSKYAVLDALDAANCGVEDSLRNGFFRSELNFGAGSNSLDLVVLSVAQLGITNEQTTLARVYSQARKLGFKLAPAETGPLLRLQYADQPVGEFLNVGMDSVRRSGGEAIILVVANGGAELLLLSQDVGTNTQFFPSSQFVFVRPAISRYVAK